MLSGINKMRNIKLLSTEIPLGGWYIYMNKKIVYRIDLDDLRALLTTKQFESFLTGDSQFNVTENKLKDLGVKGVIK